jgi:uncharacterized protein YjiS (DUF1127 family)
LGSSRLERIQIPPMPALPETEVMHLLRTIGLIWAQYRAFQAALAELEGYSSRELSDLGIARGDIARLAYEESERRVAALAASRPPVEPPASSWVKPATS